MKPLTCRYAYYSTRMQHAQSEAEKLAIVVEYMGLDWKRDHYGWSDAQIYDLEVFPFIDGTGTLINWWKDDPIGFDLRYPLDSHKDEFLRGYAKSDIFRAILMVLFGLGDYSKNQVQASNVVSTENKPSANTRVVTTPEVSATTPIKSADVTKAWDTYLGKNTTSINPRTGVSDLNRIFSADGTKSIRFGNHEMRSLGTPKGHFHYETWTYNAIDDTMTVTNVLQRILD